MRKATRVLVAALAACLSTNAARASILIESVNVQHSASASSTAYYFNPQTQNVEYVPLGGSDSASSQQIAPFASSLLEYTTIPDEYQGVPDFLPLGYAEASSTIQFLPGSPLALDVAQSAGYSSNAVVSEEGAITIQFSIQNVPATFSLHTSYSTVNNAFNRVTLERAGAPDYIVFANGPFATDITAMSLDPGAYTFTANLGALPQFGFQSGLASAQLQMSVVPETRSVFLLLAVMALLIVRNRAGRIARLSSIRWL